MSKLYSLDFLAEEFGRPKAERALATLKPEPVAAFDNQDYFSEVDFEAMRSWCQDLKAESAARNSK